MTTKLLNNRYQVIQVLGAGGFGETFLAEDTHLPSRRRCVIKQLKPLVDDPKTYEKIQQLFEREATTLEFLGEGSDQIPNLYAYFAENGLFYLVQEWIQGQTLTNIIEVNGCLDEKAVREILLSLLSVLEYVHSKGIIHRDIKPDNIIFRSSNSKPVLIDFGAVKETIRNTVNSSGKPTQSMVIGTPGYMPIEQAVGHTVFATDIYSLGLTAIYLLTGKHPQELETDPQTGKILWENYASGELSTSFKAILDRAIDPNVGSRYSTASKMLDALKSKTSTTASPAFNQNTQKTVAVSPAAGIPRNTPTPTSTNWLKPGLIFGGLLTAGLIGGVAIANFNRQQPEEKVVISQTPSDINSSPIPSREPITEVEPSEIPEIQPPSQPQIAPPQPQQQPIIEPTPEPTPENNQPSVIPIPEPQPQIISTPAPIPTPKASAPPKEIEKPVVNNTNNRSFPVFPTGISENNVKANLGQPTKVSKGLWNTRAYLYKLQPNRVDLGLLFDRQSGILRQTEASLAQSVGANMMENTLRGMLAGNINGDIQQGLQQVYQRQTNQYSFQTGGLKGVIERNQEDRIYIAVWDADLH
ncbi:protein kinase domain-containing protein [Rivularia sp. UHCC 0363]|uniref:protein kinase domain-containing protein n=1 Tax=Rivularia sp. UHCC 0363 TaxID=3110244 RepID=UPI002B20E31D|nr:protein kinase [Rivularia sp. UHCC 0363]MEA5595425.1 protein kinase [Rivularia sp. UHCC 0363]